MGVIDQLFLYRHNSLASFVIAKAAACVRDRGVARNGGLGYEFEASKRRPARTFSLIT